jgi:hypothetical protein
MMRLEELVDRVYSMALDWRISNGHLVPRVKMLQ